MTAACDGVVFDFGGVYTASPFDAMKGAADDLGIRRHSRVRDRRAVVSELTLLLLQVGFLILLWFFVFSVVGVLRTDLYGTRVSRRSQRAAAKAARAAAVPQQVGPKGANQVAPAPPYAPAAGGPGAGIPGPVGYPGAHPGAHQTEGRIGRNAFQNVIPKPCPTGGDIFGGNLPKNDLRPAFAAGKP